MINSIHFRILSRNSNRFLIYFIIAVLSPSLSFAGTLFVSTLSSIITLLVFVVFAALLIDWLFLKDFSNQMRKIFRPNDPTPEFLGEGDTFKILDKGFDIVLKGEPEKRELQRNIRLFSAQPTDYRGILPIPKLTVAEGDHIKAGQPLFYDKNQPNTMFVAPISGTVKEVKRGDKRAITDVIIERDDEIQFYPMEGFNRDNATQDNLLSFLEKSGGLTLFTQRPYGILPSVDHLPSRIFISTFDSAPLNLAYSDYLKLEDYEFMQVAIDYLLLITPDIHLGLDAKKQDQNHFANLKNCKKNWFSGKHPYGNVGVQLHNVKPLGMEEIVWTIDPQDLIVLGKLLQLGVYDSRRYYTLGGDVSEPGYVHSFAGPQMAQLLGLPEDDADDVRYISGSVLSGKKRKLNEFASAKDHQICVVPEGDHYEMFGWLIPTKVRPTMSHTYLNYLFPLMPLNANTNTHGEKRAFVMTGEYDKVLPMDTYPLPLFKAIVTNDFETMRGLGIHELLEEDVALCEFACTSKQPLQKILREGLDFVQSQM